MPSKRRHDLAQDATGYHEATWGKRWALAIKQMCSAAPELGALIQAQARLKVLAEQEREFRSDLNKTNLEEGDDA
jgi:hypothetical protein